MRIRKKILNLRQQLEKGNIFSKIGTRLSYPVLFIINPLSWIGPPVIIRLLFLGETYHRDN